jgi:hypothetical protein
MNLAAQPHGPQGAGDFHRQTLDAGHPAEAGQGGNGLDILEQGAHEISLFRRVVTRKALSERDFSPAPIAILPARI